MLERNKREESHYLLVMFLHQNDILEGINQKLKTLFEVRPGFLKLLADLKALL
jgi:hypothetical protein